MDKMFIIRISAYLRNTFHFGNEVADFIACQFALESSYGTSSLAKEYNNWCGMKVPYVRISSCTNFADNSSTYAHYSDWSMCVIDYVLLLQYRSPSRKVSENLGDFKFFIRFYCPEKDYVSRIERIYNQFINSKS